MWVHNLSVLRMNRLWIHFLLKLVRFVSTPFAMCSFLSIEEFLDKTKKVICLVCVDQLNDCSQHRAALQILCNLCQQQAPAGTWKYQSLFIASINKDYIRKRLHCINNQIFMCQDLGHFCSKIIIIIIGSMAIIFICNFQPCFKVGFGKEAMIK